jgi:GTPase SAR1 family protein
VTFIEVVRKVKDCTHSELKVILVATKCDLEAQREIEKESYIELGKKYGWLVVETSSLTYVNIEECFDLLIQKYYLDVLED